MDTNLIKFIAAKTNWAEGQLQDWANEYETEWQPYQYIDKGKNIIDATCQALHFDQNPIPELLELYSIKKISTEEIFVIYDRGDNKISNN